jgi:hypothetical protein
MTEADLPDRDGAPAPIKLFTISVFLTVRMCGSKRAHFHAFVENALDSWLSFEIAAIEHLRTRHVRDETNISEARYVAKTEKACSRIPREHFLNDVCRGIKPMLKPSQTARLVQMQLVLQIIPHARNHERVGIDSYSMC